tara:strand:+ start:344 stop:781 length:438 start_codon:yes stop_codon:yes gene_type:complete
LATDKKERGSWLFLALSPSLNYFAISIFIYKFAFMNNLWEDVKKTVSEWSVVASEKAEEFTHNSKLRLDILQLERKISSMYVKLGLYVFNKTKEKNVLSFVGDKRYISLIDNIVDIKKKIKDKKDKIDNPDYEVFDSKEDISNEK